MDSSIRNLSRRDLLRFAAAGVVPVEGTEELFERTDLESHEVYRGLVRHLEQEHGIDVRVAKAGSDEMRGAVRRVGIMGELLHFLWARKLWWLTPMVLVLLLMGILIIFAQSSAIAPFIYTIF